MPDTHDERGGGAAAEVERYARQYVAYADGDSDMAPGRPPIEAMMSVRKQLAAATAELARVNRRADFLDDALDGMRQQAIEAVKARNEATARAEKAKAERDKANLRGAKLRLVAASMLRTFVEDVHPGYAAKVSRPVPVEDIECWRAVVVEARLTADAAPDGRSATETGGDGDVQ